PWLERPWETVLDAYGKVCEWADAHYPELELYLGSEFDYSTSVLAETPEKLHGIHDTEVMLVEFRPADSFERIERGIGNVQMGGYDVLLAHIERYECIVKNFSLVGRVLDMGAMIQVNADDIVKPRGFLHKRFMKKMIDNQLIHVVGTDAHDARHRRPELQEAYRIVEKRAGRAYADRIFRENGRLLLEGELN
ncbi:MAG: hypothetical protein IJ600_02355, partial [Lachnospiraceae bacterium]|nr:hypothetical protein [Lachnospiraceae bacterium]